MITLNEFWQISKKSIKEWSEDHGSILVAAISYYAAFSIIPAFILLMGIVGFFTKTNAAEQEINRQITHLFSARAAQSVQSFLSISQGFSVGIASVFSALLLLFLGSRVFVQMQIALNIIWKVDRKRGFVKGMIRKRLISFAMMMGVGFFLFFFFLFNATIQFLSATVSDVLPQFQHAFLWGIISECTSVFIFSLFFAVIYRYVPDADIQWKDVWVGSVLTALLFAGGRYLFTLGFGRIDISSTYGAAGSLVVIMAWINFSALFFLFGAKFTHVYAKQ